ncbi:Intradiol ring-cleavage dioxygenase [metagenome]|uniref:Intradiol ring-cleavage dioxygenase n=1 Tax=metagenome TaxID=256318 RepID=A0A2P2C0K1_9ZZZZ
MDNHDELHDHDKGLSHDLPRIVSRGYGRRSLLGLLGGLGVVTVAGCAIGGSDDSTASSATSDPGAPPGGAQPPDGGESSVSVADGEIPEETAGPYPGDGSNGVNVLTESGIVRSDITSSFGSASGVAEGVPLTVNLTLVDLNGTDVAPLARAAVYLWHCNRDGEYSMYSDAVVDENYLRGVQESDADGALSFTSIFPAAYDGRWPHIHFEVYPSVADATTASNKLRTSQIALPEAVCQDVYDNADGYDASVANLGNTSLDTDMVFSDGYSLQLAKVTGSVSEGYVATLNIPL